MTTMNNEDPAKCLHKKIITYVIADGGQDHGKPAGLWACAECGRKFEPVPFAGAHATHSLERTMTTMNNEDPADPSVHEQHQAPMPCPFCGHVGLAFGGGSTFRWLAYYCAGCGMGGETRMQTIGAGTREQWRAQAERDAVAAWNVRATEKVRPGAEAKGP